MCIQSTSPGELGLGNEELKLQWMMICKMIYIISKWMCLNILDYPKFHFENF